MVDVFHPDVPKLTASDRRIVEDSVYQVISVLVKVRLKGVGLRSRLEGGIDGIHKLFQKPFRSVSLV